MNYNPLRSRWDQLLDWWEFRAARYLNRHRRALKVTAAVLALLSAIVSTWAYAQEITYVLMPQQALEAVAVRLDQLEKENAALRLRCPAGAAGA